MLMNVLAQMNSESREPRAPAHRSGPSHRMAGLLIVSPQAQSSGESDRTRPSKIMHHHSKQDPLHAPLIS